MNLSALGTNRHAAFGQKRTFARLHLRSALAVSSLLLDDKKTAPSDGRVSRGCKPPIKFWEMIGGGEVDYSPSPAVDLCGGAHKMIAIRGVSNRSNYARRAHLASLNEIGRPT